MCGIVGFTSLTENNTSPYAAEDFLLAALKKLEYRGYDSAGISVIDGSRINTLKTKGKLDCLKKLTEEKGGLKGITGIGHTRWATHGAPSDINAHPHLSGDGKFAVVHNGIIENYAELKKELMKKGVSFRSETDSEAAALLMDLYYDGDPLKAISRALEKINGSFAFAVLCVDFPDRIFAVRKDSPLIVGKGENQSYIASDIPALLEYTREIYRLEDGEIAVVKGDSCEFFTFGLTPIEKNTEIIEWDIKAAEKGGYEHFMLKEINEQPEAVANTVSPHIKDGRIIPDEMGLSPETLSKIERIYAVGCGTAYHVCAAAKYIIERMCRLHVEADVASEFRYRDPILDENTLVIIVSQSGETADTLAALREAKRKGARTLSIVNVVGSTIASESESVIYTHAGPEISVASTKAYSTQLSAVYMLAIFIAASLGKIDDETYKEYVNDLMRLPKFIAELLKDDEKIKKAALKVKDARDIYFIGRNVDYLASLEASLKLKEISYIHSEAFAGGELKHGPISLIEEGTPVIAFSCYEPLYEKMLSNIKEVKARGAYVISTAPKGKTEAENEADEVIYIPKISSFMLPSLEIIPFQLFAYYAALYRGCDIDKPRNLAKSVTVE